MNRVQEKFAELSAAGRKALIPFIMAGAPSMEYTTGLIPVLEKNGADLIEIGAPFSDPLADGPVIQGAAQQGLSRGFRLARLFELLAEVRKKTTVPLVLLIYYNLILQYGVERFLNVASQGGINGLVIPDLPPEEAGNLPVKAALYQVAVNPLVAPTSTEQRIETISQECTGFIYLVSVRGVTGERATFTSELPSLIRKVKGLTAHPVAVGFGISGPEQARQVAALADGVIVGSAIVKRITQEPLEIVSTRVGRFMKELRTAVDSVENG